MRLAVSAHSPRKRFGQNFLHDANTIGRIIAELNPAATDHFVEIGPGHGAITRPLTEQAGKLDVIEIDRDLAAALTAQPWAESITVHCTDALQFDFATLADPPAKLRLAGNLPYNISTPLLFHLLEQHTLFQDLHVMLQKEVVERMTAAPGSRVYGRLSVALAARCTVQSLFTIKPGAFTPAPKVRSAFARLTPLAEPLLPAALTADFDDVLRAAFGQRRKQLGNALKELLSADMIRAAGVDPQARAERIDVQHFIALADALSKQRNR